MDEVRISSAGDPFHAAGREGEAIEVHFFSPRQECGCYDGFEFVGHIVEGDDGEGVEVFEPVPCRRCGGGDDV